MSAHVTFESLGGAPPSGSRLRTRESIALPAGMRGCRSPFLELGRARPRSGSRRRGRSRQQQEQQQQQQDEEEEPWWPALNQQCLIVTSTCPLILEELRDEAAAVAAAANCPSGSSCSGISSDKFSAARQTSCILRPLLESGDEITSRGVITACCVAEINQGPAKEEGQRDGASKGSDQWKEWMGLGGRKAKVKAKEEEGYTSDISPRTTFDLCLAISVPSATAQSEPAADDTLPPAGRLLFYECDSSFDVFSSIPRQEVYLNSMPLALHVVDGVGSSHMIVCTCPEMVRFFERNSSKGSSWVEVDEATASAMVRRIIAHWPRGASQTLCYRSLLNDAREVCDLGFGCGDGRVRLVRAVDCSKSQSDLENFQKVDCVTSGPVLELSPLFLSSSDGSLSVVAIVSVGRLVIVKITGGGQALQRTLRVPDLSPGDALNCAEWLDNRLYLGTYYGFLICCSWPPPSGRWVSLCDCSRLSSEATLWDLLSDGPAPLEISHFEAQAKAHSRFGVASASSNGDASSEAHSSSLSAVQYNTPPKQQSINPNVVANMVGLLSDREGLLASDKCLHIIGTQHLPSSICGIRATRGQKHGLTEITVVTLRSVFVLDMLVDQCAAAACDALESVLKLQVAHREVHSAEGLRHHQA